MRPAPIPTELIWEGTERVIVAQEDGDLDGSIPPVEALVAFLPDSGRKVISVRCILEDGDLEKLTAGGAVWVTFLGTIVPFDIQVTE